MKRCVCIALFAMLVVLLITPLGASRDALGAPSERSYIVIFQGSSLPSGLDRKINDIQGTLTAAIPEIGVAAAVSGDPKFALNAAKISGVRSVVPDVSAQWTPSPLDVSAVPPQELGIESNEGFYPYQWGPKAIQAPEAWEAGARGIGVRVAVIDGGISSNHIDIQPNLDAAASASFVPGYLFNQDVPGFRHATHVAGIIAAADNTRGTIGIAPYATIVSVKALHNGSGWWSWIIAGIIYAAKDANVQVINMSLGALFRRSGFMSDNGTADDPSDDYWVSARDLTELIVAQQRAVNYAYQRGITIVVSAGNDALDADHSANYVDVPAMLEHVITVSATGPEGFAFGETDYDTPASYTNYGQSFVTLAAPGGDSRLYPGSGWYYDMVFSPSFVSGTTNYYSWAAGTSMAAPHVAGVAALVIEANGGPMAPAQVATILQQSADDLGKPGKDDYYGMGRVNAYKAVMAARAKNLAKNRLETTEQPTEMALSQNFPNPFNPTTEISYQLSASTDVKLQVFDMLGREVSVLAEGVQPAGRYRVSFDGTRLSSGVYLCKLTAGSFVATTRMLLMK